jgi:hypothetical protein
VNTADVIAEVDYLTGVAITLSQISGGIEHPTRTELVQPPSIQDVALRTAPLWGQPPSMCLTTQASVWREVLLEDEQQGWRVVGGRALEADAEFEVMRELFEEYLLAHPGVESPDYAEGLRVSTLLLDRLQWCSWASYTLLRQFHRAQQRPADGAAPADRGDAVG